MEDPIVSRGTLKLSKLKALAAEHLQQETATPTKDTVHNPHHNKEAISLIRQEDGNWKGYINKYGSVIMVRDVDPNTVLTLLLTQG